MLHISTQKLIEKLLERTRKGTIDWKEREPEGVILETEGYIVELVGSSPSVRLSHVDGRLLEDVKPEILEATQDSSGRSYASIVTELAGEADRFAKGTEQAIASILDAVEASTTPIYKSGPAFPGQRLAVETQPTKPEKADSVTETNTDPATEAGMSAAVVKMVAEINGSSPVTGDELDELTDEAQSVDHVETPAGTDTPAPEINSDPELNEFDAEALLSAELPPEPISSIPEAELEAAPIAEDVALETTDILEEGEEVPEFKTHIVDTPSLSGFAAGSMAAAAAAASAAMTDNTDETSVETTTEAVEQPESTGAFIEAVETIDTFDSHTEIPPIPSTPELDTGIEELPSSETLEISSDLYTETNDLLPPPPPPLSSPELPEDTPTNIEDDLALPTSLDELNTNIEIEDPAEPASDMHFQPFAKRTAEIAAAEQELEQLDPIDEIPELPTGEAIHAPVSETITETDFIPSSVPEIENQTVDTAPLVEPISEPVPGADSRTSSGNTFKHRLFF